MKNQFLIEVQTGEEQQAFCHAFQILQNKEKNSLKAEPLTIDGAFFVSVDYLPDGRETAAEVIADVVCERILQGKEKAQMKKIIERDFGYFHEGEKSTIFNIAFIDTKSLPAKRCAIRSVVLDYLKAENRFSMDGLLHFRMQEYDKILEQSVQHAVEKYKTDREYEEFLSLLRFFVSLQESQMETLHIVATDTGDYRLYNEKKEEITNACYLEFYKEYPYGAMRSDDFLISTMINLSPKEIYLHCEEKMKHAELKQTIYKVFGERIRICSGCSLCKPQIDCTAAEEYKKQNPLLFQ